MIKAATLAVVGIAVIAVATVWVVSLPAGDLHGIAGPTAAATSAPTEAPAAAPPPDIVSVGVDPAWLAATSAAAGIASVPLDAYALAASAQAQVSPRCGLGWNTLAGLGYAESAHGTIDGASIDGSGQLVGSILGPVLDGTRYARVADTDAGALDGDTTYDRAVGPLQFLPKTWADYGMDGNADGVLDPNNIYDAARTAAAYLCADGHDLRTGSTWVGAIRSFNPNDTYVGTVRKAATRYASLAGS